MTLLLLGGTSEARALAAALAPSHDVISSLAGVVTTPRLPVGRVRSGGFGGVTGLIAYLEQEGIDAVVDATHPFATGMRANALAACTATRTPLVRLARPGWQKHPDAAAWHWVPTYDAARSKAERLMTARQAGGRPARPFITTGRRTVPAYRPAWDDAAALVRVVEPLPDAPHSWDVVLDRGPYSPAGESALMNEHGIGVLLTKDSGGSYTAAKLDAARRLGVDVVVVSRPAPPEGLTTVAHVEDVARWIAKLNIS